MISIYILLRIIFLEIPYNYSIFPSENQLNFKKYTYFFKLILLILNAKRCRILYRGNYVFRRHNHNSIYIVGYMS